MARRRRPIIGYPIWSLRPGSHTSSGAALRTRNCWIWAAGNKLRDPAVLEQQLHRMVADPRSENLAKNFAAQWLFLRNLRDVQPDNYIFLDFDVNLREAMLRETELLFDTIVRQDRRILDLLDADYTFVNERLRQTLWNSEYPGNGIPSRGDH